ncbi:hypothetical protein IMSHALPRED_002540 [Imshaugia aleurites]|uniref:Uncharacterized protein n=1 Tax=Imshaugia aleurites TaxID=172621 RepID=A0A8H3PI50_9LECA|nr:hypothetical protein IMSHALPRED_002540 [Imshaugia aleurites]
MPNEATEQVKEQYDTSAKEAQPSSAEYGVGGTAKDGDVSTADTVADGGPDEDQGADEEFKP